MTRDPLATQPGDDALLQAVLADESKLRNEIILLDAMSVFKPDAQRAVTREALTAIRVLWNAAKERTMANV